MRVLCSCVPATSRFQVLAPLARALADMGNEIAFVTPAQFQCEVSAAGFETLVTALALSELRAAASACDPGLSPDQQAALMFIRIAPLALRQELLPLAEAWRPDVILHEEGEYGGPLIGALIGVPTVVIGWPVPLRLPRVLRRRDAALAETWTAAGLTPSPLAGLYDQLFLDTCPPSLQSAHAAAITTRQPLRPMLDTARSGDLPASVLRRIPGVPTVHLTFGTVLSLEGRTLNIVQQTVEALRGESIRLIVSVGDSNDPKIVGPDSDDLIVVRYLSHRALLPHCDAVICHGGAGSPIAALSHGLPLLIVPRDGASQHRSAFACAQTGAGLTLHDEDISPAAIRKSVRALLEVDGYRLAARRVAAEIRSMPDPHLLVPAIERVARGGRVV